MTEQITPAPDSPDLAGEYVEAREKLKMLLVEQDDLRSAISRAGESDFDADQFVAARERLDRLPVLVLDAQIRAQRKRIAVLEQRESKKRELQRREIEAATEVYERLQVLEAEYGEAINRRDNARVDLDGTRMDLAAARRELQDLVGEFARPHSPVVRSRWHAA